MSPIRSPGPPSGAGRSGEANVVERSNYPRQIGETSHVAKRWPPGAGHERADDLPAATGQVARMPAGRCTRDLASAPSVMTASLVRAVPIATHLQVQPERSPCGCITTLTMRLVKALMPFWAVRSRKFFFVTSSAARSSSVPRYQSYLS